MSDDGRRRHVELGVRGDPNQVSEAMSLLCAAVREAGYAFREP
jgi:hypothetical protein